MLRSILLGLASLSVSAAAQTAPVSNPQPMQPGPPQAQPPASADPNAVPSAPPTFVPGLNGDDTSNRPRPHVVRISSGVMAGQLLTRQDPVYPAEAQGMEGTVVMSARIGKDGHVASLAVVSGPNVLQAAAVNAVKQWTYRPYLLNGEPVDVMTTIVIAFHGH